MEEVAHPYVPRDLKLPGYVPISMSMSTILTVYLGVSLFVVTLVWFLFGNRFPSLHCDLISKLDARFFKLN
ncbi:unnamed protein product [Thlaspi arvense]|uniref:ATP synthase F0 subunit 8 n=1 Tax=Thlaspi arvense TaxID=13288 RepID=A0AAU9RAH5_THLAR|nr:unnamed protein product [Thlaspi arvense]